MAKKNYGRVRRYRNSYYRGRVYWTKRVLAIAATLLVLFGIGWFVGPAVIDFGTGTWYGLKNKDKPTTAQDVPEPAEVLPVETPTPTFTPTPTPPPTRRVDTSAGWRFVETGEIDTQEKAKAVAEQLAAENVGYAVFTLKDKTGTLYYPSEEELAQPSLSEMSIDWQSVIEAFEAEDIRPVARVYLFEDHLAPYADTSRTAAVHYENSDYYWLDAAAENGGKPWLSPYSELACAYTEAVVKEVRHLGFEHILLGGVQFPNGASERCNYGPTGGVPYAERLYDIVSQWQNWSEEKNIDLWFEYGLFAAAAQPDNPSSALGGCLSQLGADRLVISMPVEQDEYTKVLLERALAGNAGSEYLVLKDGSSAEFVLP